MDKLYEELAKKVKENPPVIQIKRNELVVKYLVKDKQIECVCIALKDNDHIKIGFSKGHLVVSTETSVVFMCKAKDFISLWL